MSEDQCNGQWPVPEAPVPKAQTAEPAQTGPVATRGQVHTAIDGERAYQTELVAEGGKFEGRGALSVDEEIELLEHYAAKAALSAALSEDDEGKLGVVREIAAIAVRCMENNGAPKREGY